MKYFTYLLFIAIIGIACKKQAPKETARVVNIEKDIELEQLVAMMTGSYSSEQQAKLDTNFREHMLHIYPIWPDKEGKWMYAEFADTENQEEPYKQHIYKISRDKDSILKKNIFTIPNANIWVCKWQNPKFFDRLLPESITLKEGCTHIFHKTEEASFKGKTNEKNCPSSLKGAAYTISEIEISEKKIISWERGFNDQDSLVWGSKQIGYEFDKL